MRQFFLITILLFSANCFAQSPTVKWYYDIRDNAFGQSAAADVDNDGKLEIVFSTYRNDSNLYVINAENGSLKWKFNAGGCADAAPLIYDVDQNGDLEIVLAGSCNPVTFCLDADSGFIQWQVPMYGSDSPPTIADLDNDGKLEILHGQFTGYVISINGENGTVNWNFQVDTNCWVQTEPIILDANKDGQLDFVVATWSFDNPASAIYAFKGNNRQALWKNDLPSDVMYHGAAFGDLDKDGKQELTIGDYNAHLYCLNAEDGSVHWRDSIQQGYYLGAPTSLADLDNDGWLDVVMFDAYYARARKHDGSVLWNYPIPGNATSFRGAAIADVNNDSTLDVTFGTSKGMVISIDGKTGSLIRSFDLAAHYGSTDFDIDHAPLVADFDGDGILDVFIVGGHTTYPNVQNNWGRAYLLSWGVGKGPDWLMFRRDERRSACVCDQNGNPLPPLGIKQQEIFTNTKAVPNPASAVVSLQLPQRIKTSEVMVIDMLGRSQKVPFTSAATSVNLDVRSLVPGEYLIRLSTESGLLFSSRFSKQ